MALIKYIISHASAAALPSGQIIPSMSNSPPAKIIDSVIEKNVDLSNLESTTRFWNNLYQVRRVSGITFIRYDVCLE